MKSVYSLVLSDEVISQVDKMAFKEGVSRSQYINDILATAVGIDTEKKLIQDIFDQINIFADEMSNFRVQRGSQTGLDFLSSLNYKYSPKVTYSVALYEDNGLKGDLKITLRTTNPLLLEITTCFFNDFMAIEKTYNLQSSYSVVGGKLIRKLNFKNNMDISKQITDYVSHLDKLFNEYIESYGENSFKNLETGYLIVMEKMKI